MNIGLLEDNQPICDYMTVALNLYGHQVEQYATGDSLLEQLSPSHGDTLPYDIMLVDLNLPGKASGQDVIASIRSHPSTEHLPIVIMTGAHARDILMAQEKFPSIPIIKKPFRMRELLDVIHETCPLAS